MLGRGDRVDGRWKAESLGCPSVGVEEPPRAEAALGGESFEAGIDILTPPGAVTACRDDGEEDELGDA